MSFEDETTEAHELRITRCRSCRARIIWFKTAFGNNMPVDADSVEPEDEELDLTRHVLHWRTCSRPDLHRIPK